MYPPTGNGSYSKDWFDGFHHCLYAFSLIDVYNLKLDSGLLAILSDVILYMRLILYLLTDISAEIPRSMSNHTGFRHRIRRYVVM